MSMALIAVTPQFPMTIIWITCTMGIYIISTTTNTDLTVDMSPFHMVITLITYTTDIYTPPTATTGTNTKYSVSGRDGVR
jgi:hypothetical protein